MHCTPFSIGQHYTQGGVHIKVSTPITIAAMKAAAPRIISAQVILLIVSPNCLLEGYQEPSVIFY